MAKPKKEIKQGAVAALILAQSVCVVFFLSDVVSDAIALGHGAFTSVHLSIESLAVFGLVLGIVFKVCYLLELMTRNERAERGMRVASGALHNVMEDYFSTWDLTPAERDVAMFTIKGLSISEIASLRKSRQGTIKTHLSAIYRKADVSGRSQLTSLLIEDLMSAPLVVEEKRQG
jgi:DNA-binding NarL/FixJ family response regulator